MKIQEIEQIRVELESGKAIPMVYVAGGDDGRAVWAELELGIGGVTKPIQGRQAFKLAAHRMRERGSVGGG